MYITTNKEKEAMNLRESKKYMERFGGRKGEGVNEVIVISKNKKIKVHLGQSQGKTMIAALYPLAPDYFW